MTSFANACHLNLRRCCHGYDERVPARSDEGLGGAADQGGRYSNASDYIRDLIRRDQERALKIAAMQKAVTEGLESGTGSRSMDELREIARMKVRSSGS